MTHTDNYRAAKLMEGKWAIERQRADGTWHVLPMCYPTQRAALASIAERLDYFRQHQPRQQSVGTVMQSDTPEQVARWTIAAYREYLERYAYSPDDATEAAVREVLEGLAVDVEAVRADMAAHPGPTPEEMEEWPL